MEIKIWKDIVGGSEKKSLTPSPGDLGQRDRSELASKSKKLRCGRGTMKEELVESP